MKRLGKHWSKTAIFLFLLNDPRVFLILTSNARARSNPDYSNVLWQRASPFDQKELSKELMDEEFKLSG